MSQQRPVALQRRCFSPEKNCQHYNRQEGGTADENGNNTYLGLPTRALPSHLDLKSSQILTLAC
jgi:hypothetical protein